MQESKFKEAITITKIYSHEMDSSFIEPAGLDEPALPIELKASVFRPFAYRVLSKKYGLNVQSSALEKLAAYVGKRFGTKWKRDAKTAAFLDALAKLWKEQERGIFVDGEGVTQVIKELSANEKRMKQRLQNALAAKRTHMDQDLAVNDPANETSIDLDSTTFDTSIVMSSQNNIDQDESQEIIVDDHINWKLFFKVIDPNHYTSFEYDRERKQFEYFPSKKTSKLIQMPKTDAMLKYYIARIDILRDRIYRNNIFTKTKYNTDSDSKVTNQMHQPKHITYIKNLLGRNEQRFVLFGLVTLNSFGIWQLQDDTDKIELVLKQCVFTKETYFTSGNFLIVDGFYSSAGKFHVLSMEHPPAEERISSLDALGDMDFNWDYSKNGKVDVSMKKVIQRELQNHSDHKIVILGGNLYLDDMDVLAKLKKVLKEIDNEIQFYLDNKSANSDAANIYDRTVAIIFNGPFVSKALDVTEGSSANLKTSSASYKASFDNLASILEHFKNICENCKLIFIPGDEDPWLSMITKNANSIWPKMRIPSVFGSRLMRVAKDIEWASNPCRLNYLSHDIAFMRDDIGDSFRRNDFTYLCELTEEEIDKAMRHHEKATENHGSQMSFLNQENLEIDRLTLKESTDTDKIKKIAKTLLDQGTMVPFHNTIREVLPNYLQLLSLLPLPHCLIISDATTPVTSTMYKGCMVANVGTFMNRSVVKYLEYYPSSQVAKTKTVY